MQILRSRESARLREVSGLPITRLVSLKASLKTAIHICPFDTVFRNAGIKHKLIPPRTPWHNGKVERSHRKDQERFYYKKEFKSFEEFEKKLRYWEKEYNNFPMKPLGWKSPNEQLKEYKLKKSA